MGAISPINITSMIREHSFHTEFQPLLSSADGGKFAYEAFIRTDPFKNPLTIFTYARNEGLLYEVDTASMVNAINEYPAHYFARYSLFLNVFPSSIVHPEFPAFVKLLMADRPEIKYRIVFEINEDIREQSIWGRKDFLSRLRFLRAHGFKIALDDLLITKQAVQMIKQFRPDFVKLDRSCCDQLSASLKKQKKISGFLGHVDHICSVVLEGIETEEDRDKARELGVPLLQGYYISRPHRLK
ncbi:EAL domain-containing protein [Peribacillus sp. SCS-155]|uniref:EAL domain-containing protein n=1 Tax=Peribacillus sedimenti TaxID=3115297 RepID=UPI003905ED4E